MKIYSEPKLKMYPDCSKGWYVWFRYKGTLVKKTGDINRLHDLKEREKAGNDLVKFFKNKLKNGYNPLVPGLDDIEGADLSFYQALEFSINKKEPKLDNKTVSAYKTTIRYSKEAISALNLNYLPIRETKRVHIKIILEAMQKSQKLSAKAYNKHLGHIHALLAELIQWDVLEKNPSDNIKRQAVSAERANIPPTPSQEKLIWQTLKRFYPNFYKFVAVLWHTGIRPVEISRIKIGMIDKKKKRFILPAEITKTKKERIVDIDAHLWPMLEPLLLNPDSFYLFGSYRMPAKGNIGKYIDFIPGPTKMNRDTATKRWEKIVKMKLGISASLYSMKKAGANAKIIAGMSIRTIKEIYGHSSEVTTEIYITNLEERIRKEILEKSPSITLN